MLQTHTGASPSWTEKDRRKVKRLLENGATGAVVGRAMGISRNAALGRIWRDPSMKLTWGTYHVPRVKKKPKPKKPSPEPTPQTVPVPPPGLSVCTPEAVEPPVPVAVTSKGRPMALIGTGRRWCKFPIREDRETLGHFLCCGHLSLPGDVYCKAHRDIAHQPSRSETDAEAKSRSRRPASARLGWR